MSVTVKPFDTLRDGRTANLYTIENQKGMQAVLTDFGAILVKLLVPDQDGKLRDVVLGYDELEKYEDNFDMLGTTVGRNVNRIEKGRFTIDGKPHVLTEGQSIIMPVNIPHAVYGEERFKMLLTVVF